MTREEFHRFTDAVLNVNPPAGQRRGQYLVNRLAGWCPAGGHLVGAATAVGVDPFYDDAKIPAFLDWAVTCYIAPPAELT